MAGANRSGKRATVAVSLTPGPMDPQYFASEATGQNGFTIDGITWNGTDAATAKGTTPNISAAPLGMGTDTTTGTTYMSVEGGGVETATWATTQTSLSIYWGSIDGNGGNLNSISISMGAYTLTGMQLAMMGADGSGNQTDPLGNQLIRSPVSTRSRRRRSRRPPMRSNSALVLACLSRRPGR